MKEGNVLFNDALSTFYLRLYGVGQMIKDHSAAVTTWAALRLLCASSHRQDSTSSACLGRNEMFYLTTHSNILFTVIWRQTYGKVPHI